MGVKVTFDPATRIIQVDKAPVLDGDDWVVDVDTKIDLFSDGKEDWKTDDDLNRLKFAFKSAGGDAKPGGELGATFFLEHNWKIRPYEGDHWLRIDGNLFSRDGSSPFIKTVGAYNVVITQNVSDIVEVVNADTGDVADAVWSHADAVFLKDVEGGRWRIIANQMIFYEADNVTEVARFNLFDAAGDPTMENVYERKRVVDSSWRYPYSMFVNIGSVASGSLADLILDDGNRLELNEVTGSPGFDYTFFFSKVQTSEVEIQLNGYYEGNPAHNVKIKVMNWGTYEWDVLTGDAQDFPSRSDDAQYNFNLPAPKSQYVSDGGHMALQIIHESNGSAGHLFSIDKLELVEL